MLSSRAAVRRLFEEMTDDLDEINLPLIADEVTAAVKDNPELLALFLEEHLRPMVYDVGFAVLANQRARSTQLTSAVQQVQAVVTTPTSRSVALRGKLLAPPTRGQSRRFAWLRQPVMIATGRHIRLERARQHELDLAIAANMRRLGPARQRVAHFALVRDALANADQTVGDALSEDQLAALWQEAGRRIEREDTVAAMAATAIAAGKARAKSAPVPAT